MLTRNVTFEGFTTTDWLRLSCVVGRGRSERSAVAAREGGVVAVTTGDRLRKIVSTARGRLDLSGQPWPEALDAVAARYDASWAAKLRTGALEELMDRFADRLQPQQDLLEQALLLLTVARELVTEGAIDVWPWRLGAWPVPSARVAIRALDALCPDGKSITLGVFEGGDVYTCIAARRMGPGFDRVVGPETLRGEMGLVSGDWARDYRHLARAVESRAGPLALGCFAELSTFRRLVRDPAPGAWARAVAARDVLLAPASPAVALPIGVDLGRVALATFRAFAERIGAGEVLGPGGPLAPALERVRRAAIGDRHLESLLGFDPFDLLRKLLARTRDTGR